MMNCLSSMPAEITPPGVILQHHSVEYFAEPVWCNREMDPDEELVSRRRKLLKQEIARSSQADVARRAGKPDRQIGDMAEGRKAFGDSVAREIGPRLRPDLPRDWLIFADDSINVEKREGDQEAPYPIFSIDEVTTEGLIDALAKRLTKKTPSVMEYAISKIRMVYDMANPPPPAKKQANGGR